MTPGNLGDELAAFMRAMRAANLAPTTLLAYGGAVRQFGIWLMDHGHPTTLEDIEGRHIEDFINSILDQGRAGSPGTAHNRFRGIQRFINWYGGRVDDFASPMTKLRPPRLPAQIPRVLTLDEIRAVIGTCTGRAFDDQRDEAVVRCLFDTGARRREISNLRYSDSNPDERDINMSRGLVQVLGKGNKPNTIGLSDHTLGALDDYLRHRRRHENAHLPWLWLGKRGRLSDSGIAQMLRSRGQRVGIDHLHAHDFRHAASHFEMASGGMTSEEIMSKRGWDSPAMLRRYASTTATERSIAASRRIAIGDKV